MARQAKKPKTTRQRRKILRPKTRNQETYMQSINKSDVTFCSGPAGSGKTSVSVGMACEYLIEKKVDKIIITRPVVESGRGLGHLPGTLVEKINPYLIPILEEMNHYLTRNTVETYRNRNIIELCPLEYMRGRNFHNCFMILDEAQNATFEQIKMFITRIGKDSKAVINGDLRQSDLGKHQGGLKTCMDKLVEVSGVGVCKLDYSDIVRSGIVSKILMTLNKEEDENEPVKYF
ncbi:PhoH family protein [Ulvibacter sp.]|nr:PhoH family protein [Ulvibacter sp.]|tara:strand:+ start:574 stop:1272 length:699 start_codon:yes stop_codon:yes gene_type:complete